MIGRLTIRRSGVVRPHGTKRPNRRYRLSANARMTSIVVLAWGKATSWSLILKSDPAHEFKIKLAGLVSSMRYQKERAAQDYRDLLAQLRRIEVARQRGSDIQASRVIDLAKRLEAAGRYLTPARRAEIAATISASGAFLMSEAQKAARRARRQRRSACAEKKAS